MTKTEAERAALLIQERFPDVHANACDPRAFRNLTLDRWTVEMIREAVARLAAACGDVGHLLEDFAEFIAYAHAYSEGEEPWPGLPPATRHGIDESETH